MILGKITGKSTTNNFTFQVSGNAKKFQYVQIPYLDDYALAQIIELEKDSDKTIAYCNILGYKKNNNIKPLSSPLEPGHEVLKASDHFINKTLNLVKTDKSAFIGTLQDYENINIYLDLNKILNKHIAILAKTGSGKCISPNTKILLEDGSYEKVENLVNEELKKGSYFDEGIEISKQNPNLNVFSLNNNHEIVKTKVKAMMRRKYDKDLVLIKTRSGKTLKVTKDHKIPTLNEFIFWKNAEQLNSGDFLLIPKPKIEGKEQSIDILDLWKNEYKLRVKNKEVIKKIKEKIYKTNTNLKEFSKKFNISYTGFKKWFDSGGIPLKNLIKMCSLINLDFNIIKKDIKYLYANSKKIPTKIRVDKDFSKLLAYYLAEGHNNGKTIIFTNYSLEIQREFKYLIKKLFDVNLLNSRENEFRVNNLYLSKTLQKLGFTNSSWTKFIPKEIITSKSEVINSFLETFIDCDGHLTKNSSSLEINLASKPMIDSLESMFIRLNIIPIKKNKKINNKVYPKLTISGSKNFKILHKELNLKIKHKKERLNYYSKINSNPNLDLIPNISENLKIITNVLNMHESETKVKSFNVYLRKEKCPSITTLQKLLKDIEKKYSLVEENINQAILLYQKLPKINEEDALNQIKKGYSSGLNFTKLSQNINVSSTTVKRMIYGITNLTNNVYPVAENVLKNSNLKNESIETINKLNFIKTITKIKEICLNLGYGLSSLCLDNNRHKGYLYEKSKNPILYSELLNFSKRLKEIALSKSQELQEVKFRLSFLKSITKNNLYFDEITSIKKIKYNGYVYDLETEEHNFIANNIIIHNSYTSGVLLEELIQLNIPILIIDPHGEYSSLKYPTEDINDLAKFKLKPKGFTTKIQEYAVNTDDNPDSKKLKLSMYNISSHNLMQLLPVKLTNIQQNILYSALKEVKNPDFDSLIAELEIQDHPGKFQLLNTIDYLKKMNIFSQMPTSLQELIQPGKCSTINLRGVEPELQEVIVYKLLYDLFEARKKSNVPPFFLIIEEAHNYIPERNYGEVKSSKIIRQISAEGRKFGLGLCIITQRPSRIEKTVLSQCNTQMILKVTNPNDVNAIVSSVEGITSETKNEIKNLPIGTSMVTGIIDIPLFVEIRPRITKHGGESVNIASLSYDENGDEGELLNVIKQNYSLEDAKIMNEGKELSTVLVPSLFLNCGDFNVVVNLYSGELIKDIESASGMKLKFNVDLSPQQKRIFDIALQLKEFTAAEIFARSQVQFSEIYDTLNTLAEQNYIEKDGNKFKVTNSFNINFSDYFIYAKPEYAKVKHDKILEKQHNAEQIQHFLQSFIKIKSAKECYLVKYET
jgi:DNA helicase HerA-like ATPase/intein/homing endonuclease